MVISTTEESKKLQRKMMEKKDRKRKVEVDKRGEKDVNISYVIHIIITSKCVDYTDRSWFFLILLTHESQTHHLKKIYHIHFLSNFLLQKQINTYC
jgi:bacterioferritin (cytochrome b1)